MTTTSINRASGWREEGIFRPVGMLFEKLFQGIGGKYQYLMAHPGFRRSPTLTLARLLRWRVQCALGIAANLSLPEWDAHFYLPPRWHGAGTTMIYALRSSYENELKHLSRFVSPGMVVVDGGASCGIYTVAAAKLVGSSGLVLSFEPGAEAFSVLRENIELNGLKNVRIKRAALSEKEGKAALYHHSHGPNSFSLGPSEAPLIESEEVTIRTLSRAAQEEGVQRIDVIKLDVEGAEEFVLRDAEQLIACFRPVIILEVNGIASQRLGLDPVGSCRVLQKLGYTFFSLTEWGDLCPLDHPPLGNEIINVIAIHEKGRQ